MKAINSYLPRIKAPAEIPFQPELVTSAERIIEFYEAAGIDYGHWSKGFNMHLGFYGRGMNPFDREAMLEQLNLEVADRLGLDPERPATLIDFGCGMGAIARTVAENYPKTNIKGITLVPSQVEIATRLNAMSGLAPRIEILEDDYTNCCFENNSADGIWAVESACYARGAAKEDIISEAARILKVGGRFVVADCFIKRPETKLNFLVKKCYSAVRSSWALSEMPSLEHFVTALARHGFRDIVVEDISWRTAPSLAHAPFTVLTFVIKKRLAGEPLSRHSIGNLKASLLALILGLDRPAFSYYLITGTRGEA